MPAATPCATAAPPVIATVTRMSTTRTNGFTLRGEARWEGAAMRDDALTLTAVVFDASDQVLDVLTGTPDPAAAGADTQGAQVRRFTLSSPIPIGRLAKRAVVYAEVLDAPGSVDNPAPW